LVSAQASPFSDALNDYVKGCNGVYSMCQSETTYEVKLV
jgi:hypothetical protein